VNRVRQTYAAIASLAAASVAGKPLLEDVTGVPMTGRR
jgi:hypothetical protein